ncbi:HEPN domain-containing protein, partial [Candidatus Saganbacteria bacterium]|nr:HEPN domain-containing protein [Candidatus Saganbacteria bacterium]
YIVAHELEFKKIHNLLTLLKICSAHNPALNQILEDCTLLNSYYIDTRYPVHWPTNHTREVTEQARAAVRRIAGVIKGFLPKSPC